MFEPSLLSWYKSMFYLCLTSSSWVEALNFKDHETDAFNFLHGSSINIAFLDHWY